MEPKSRNLTLKAILITIAIGIWVIVLQNAGIIPTSQKVEVTNQVEVLGKVSVSGSVDVDNTVSIIGSVDVDNTVSVSVDEVLGPNGKKYYLKNY